jgi:hypothetical protein
MRVTFLKRIVKSISTDFLGQTDAAFMMFFCDFKRAKYTGEIRQFTFHNKAYKGFLLHLRSSRSNLFAGAESTTLPHFQNPQMQFDVG